MSNAVGHEIRDGVAWITIDRPEVGNALDGATFRRLTDLVADLGRDDGVRCIVVRGGGDRVFVSGADIREFHDHFATPEAAIAYDAEAEQLNLALEAVPQPVIAMLNGHAIGSGCLLAIACDFRIASARAKLGIPVARIGFPPGPGDLIRLARLVGSAWAKRLLMSGEIVDAATARGLGLVEEVAEPDALAMAVERLARSLAANAPLSLRATKGMAARFLDATPAFADGLPWSRVAYGSRDLQEGIDALLTKRPPVFAGR